MMDSSAMKHLCLKQNWLNIQNVLHFPSEHMYFNLGNEMKFLGKIKESYNVDIFLPVLSTSVLLTAEHESSGIVILREANIGASENLGTCT